VTEREDRQDIAEVLLRYATGIDRRDWPLFRTAFTDDCELDYGEIGTWNGVDAVTEFMKVASAPSVSTTTSWCARRRVGASRGGGSPRCG